jgi:hypothetical protein
LLEDEDEDDEEEEVDEEDVDEVAVDVLERMSVPSVDSVREPTAELVLELISVPSDDPACELAELPT